MPDKIAISSSMMASIEYEPETLTLRAEMKDGSIYDVPEVSIEEYSAFSAAPSKGKHWHKHFKSRASITGVPRQAAIDPESSIYVDSYQEDECCGLRLASALRRNHVAGDEWTCPKCGCRWSGRVMPESSIRHWTPVFEVEVIQFPG